MAKLPEDELRKLALKLRLYGLLANWGRAIASRLSNSDRLRRDLHRRRQT